MALTLWLWVLGVDVAPARLSPVVPEAPVEEFVPPQPLTATSIAFPENAPPLAAPVVVTVKLLVDTAGEVAQVEVVQSGGAVLDEAVLTGATHFRFEPGRYRGEPVEVEITFSQEFLPQEPPRAEDADWVAVLHGTVEEKGTRRPLGNVTVIARDGVRELRTEANDVGVFRLRLPAGRFEVEVLATGSKRFLVTEELAAEQEVEVRYLVERLSYDPYETIVIGKRERTEVGRTTLRGRELKTIPGTFGDPFRVIATLPGVAQVFSLLNYPLVRGTSPGSTGFLLDGTRVPQLFHLLAGPAVIHPEFIERVDFFPGSFGVPYGGYTGGIVDGASRRAVANERRLDLEIDLTKAGLFVRRPMFGATGTVAGRYGYPGFLLGLLNTGSTLSYWDYQARLDGGQEHRWTLFAFGSFDEAGEKDQVTGRERTLARSTFHRFDVRVQSGDEDSHVMGEVVFGFDQVLSGGDEESDPEGDGTGTLSTWSAQPRLVLSHRLARTLSVHVGLEGAARRFLGQSELGDAPVLDLTSEMFWGGAFAETVWKPWEEFAIIPGVRADTYHNDATTKSGVDPRLTFRYRVGQNDNGDFFLKGGAGVYHQPPRFLIPLPGFEELALKAGLMRSYQTSLGFEAPLGGATELDVQAYYSHMDPIIFDLTINPDDACEPAPPPADAVPEEPPAPPPEEEEQTLDELVGKRRGRSYGLELLLRQRDVGPLFGWLSYTLSRSERRDAGKRGGRWVLFDFDRTHMLHLVAGVQLPRNWDVSARFQVQSGRPVTTCEAGYNADRSGIFFRADLRIDKRAVYNDWLFDFYIDIINITVAPENLEGTPDGAIRYLLPTVGFRAVL